MCDPVAGSFPNDSDMSDTCTICSSGSLPLAAGTLDVGTVLGLPVEKYEGGLRLRGISQQSENLLIDRFREDSHDKTLPCK